MKDPSGFKYAVIVWIITVLVSPVISVFASTIYHSSSSEDFSSALGILLIMAACGFVFAHPALFLFWFLYAIIRSSNTTVLIKKLLLSVSGISLIVLTFCVFYMNPFTDSDFDTFIWPLTYAIILVATIFLVKITAAPVDGV